MSLAVIFEQQVRGQNLTLREVMRMEYKLCWSYQHDLNSDFYEGIRATIIDKDKKPSFRHKHVSEVTVQDL